MSDDIYKEKPTNKRCKVCGGMIVARLRLESEVTALSISTVRGPTREIELGYHCAGCGIEYHKVP